MIQRAVKVLVESLAFYGTHSIPIVALALLAALGRVIQLGWEDPGTAVPHWGLELLVEGARLAILVVIVRATIAALPVDARTFFAQLWPKLQQEWRTVLWSTVVFALFAVAVNSAISWLAEQRFVHQVFQALPGTAALRPDRTGMLVVFSLKNLTIIPFTLVWLFYGMARLLR